MGFYQSLVDTEDIQSYLPNNQPKRTSTYNTMSANNIEGDKRYGFEKKHVPDVEINDLHEAKNRIQELEDKLRRIEAKIENRIPKNFPGVKFLNYKNRRRILVTGGAGFVGSHLVDRLMLVGHEVIVVDNFFTGRKRNIEHWVGHENFELVHHDIVRPLYLEVDEIYHLASPASPPHYMLNPVKTLKTNTLGTINMLGLAKRVGARVLIASTSEIYGDPNEHPQTETYWGHVNPIGKYSYLIRKIL